MASVSQSPAPRAVIYAPFSIREQGEGGYSLDAQAADGRKLAIELGTLRKLGKARRLASANSVNRAARRLQATGAAPEPPPTLTRSTAAKPRRHRS